MGTWDEISQGQSQRLLFYTKDKINMEDQQLRNNTR